jgi:hypothetical protein
MKYTNYVIFTADEPYYLADQVREYINGSWFLQGGVSVVVDPESNKLIYCQALAAL